MGRQHRRGQLTTSVKTMHSKSLDSDSAQSFHVNESSKCQWDVSSLLEISMLKELVAYTHICVIECHVLSTIPYWFEPESHKKTLPLFPSEDPWSNPLWTPIVWFNWVCRVPQNFHRSKSNRVERTFAMSTMICCVGGSLPIDRLGYEPGFHKRCRRGEIHQLRSFLSTNEITANTEATSSSPSRATENRF